MGQAVKLMWWLIAVIAIPGGVFVLLVFWVAQKCGVYKIEGPPYPRYEEPGNGLYVEGTDLLHHDHLAPPPADTDR